ncbi:tyrosine-protein phosphatase [Rhodococcus opacus]|nr:tyrosine-protein phosphatase [Rhodococcus opacus]
MLWIREGDFPVQYRSGRARRAVVIAVLGAAVLGATPPAFADPAATGPSVAVGSAQPPAAPRSLGLEGARNARDIGGYSTADGGVVRSGVVFRTDALDRLTPRDLAQLESSNVTVVDDLRTTYERALAPDRLPAGADGHWYDVLGQSPITTLVDMPAAYRAFVTGPGANEAFSAVLHDIAESDGAVIYHCSAGKDRTGWATAVLLTVLGVPRETVNADYLLSNTYRGADPEHPGLDGVDQAWLDSAFDTAVATYGSFDAYVSEGLKLSDGDITKLKSRLLD